MLLHQLIDGSGKVDIVDKHTDVISGDSLFIALTTGLLNTHDIAEPCKLPELIKTHKVADMFQIVCKHFIKEQSRLVKSSVRIGRTRTPLSKYLSAQTSFEKHVAPEITTYDLFAISSGVNKGEMKVVIIGKSLG